MVVIRGPVGPNRSTGYSRPWSVRTRIAVVAVALPVIAILSAAAITSPAGGGFFGDFIGVTFVVVFSFCLGVINGLGAAWSALSLALAGVAASTVGGALVFGVLAGLAVTLVQRLSLPGPAPVKKSLAATLASKEFWVASGIDSLRLLATNLAAAYGVVLLMSALGALAAPEDFAAGLQHLNAIGGSGMGGDHTFGGLLFALVFAIGLLIGIGCLSGASFGAIAGALFGTLGWTGLAVPALKGAAKGATIAIFEHEQKSLALRALTGAYTGALNGAVGGMVVALVLGSLQLLGLA